MSETDQDKEFKPRSILKDSSTKSSKKKINEQSSEELHSVLQGLNRLEEIESRISYLEKVDSSSGIDSNLPTNKIASSSKKPVWDSGVNKTAVPRVPNGAKGIGYQRQNRQIVYNSKKDNTFSNGIFLTEPEENINGKKN